MGSISKPFFTIIIPIHNTPEEYFKECMQSIMQQSYNAFEALIIDDGSDESCAAFCDRYASADKHFRVLHQTGKGVSAARNRGIEEAEGEWILFVDADDWLETNSLEVLSNTLKDIDCDILFFRAVKEYSEKSVLLEHGLDCGKTYCTDDVAIREMMYRRAMGVPESKKGRQNAVNYCWDKAYRRDFLQSNGIRFPEGVPKSEDKVFILLCFEKMKNIYCLDAALYHYRINSASVCNRYSGSADEDRSALAERLCAIARRMDRELGGLLDDPGYSTITHEFHRFIFGIISDVLLLKYYHPDHKAGVLKRHGEARAFLKKEPFNSSIRKCSYRELSAEAQLKKFLLSCKMTGVFCKLKNAKKTRKGAVAE